MASGTAADKALVVFLRGVNVGGSRTFRPKALADELDHLGAVNIGAAGTFVIRRPVSPVKARAEFARRLPFETEMAICAGAEITRLLGTDPFARHTARPDIVPFVSVLTARPRSKPPLPVTFPPSGPWLLQVFALDGPFVLGLYRRQMKAVGYLGKLDALFGTPVTTRNWNTITAIGKVLTGGK